MVVVKIDVKKIDKDLLFRGEKGIYLDAALIEKPDKYGNDGFIGQSVGKEARAAGERGPIIGTWKTVGNSQPRSMPKAQQIDEDW